MPNLRTTALLTLVLLAPACGDDGGGATQDSTGDPNATTGAATGATDPTDTADTDTTASTDESATVAPTTTTDGSTSTGTVEPDTDTDADTSTGGPPPDPCAGLAAPEPASAIDWGELFHDIRDQRYAFDLEGHDVEGVDDNSWSLFIDNLGPEEPIVGSLMGLEIIASEQVGMSESGTVGTATIEIVEITADCVTGRISDVVTEQPTMWIGSELPGGFVIGRRAL